MSSGRLNEARLKAKAAFNHVFGEALPDFRTRLFDLIETSEHEEEVGVIADLLFVFMNFHDAETKLLLQKIKQELLRAGIDINFR